MGVEYFPLDVSELEKGDVIAPEVIERISLIKRGTDKYAFTLLQWRNRITHDLRSIGKPATVVIRKDSLAVLTDAEAAHYNPRQFRHGFRKLLRAHTRLMHVDVRKLDEAAKAALERNIIVQGKMIMAARSARQIELTAHKRTTPGLPKPSDD